MITESVRQFEPKSLTVESDGPVHIRNVNSNVAARKHLAPPCIGLREPACHDGAMMPRAILGRSRLDPVFLRRGQKISRPFFINRISLLRARLFPDLDGNSLLFR